VQAVLTANLIRRGVIDQIIPREEMPEWAKVLADVACKPLAARVLELEAENKRLRETILDARLIAVDAQLRATYQKTALERISDLLRTALKGEEI
jgi:hypothetical protein